MKTFMLFSLLVVAFPAMAQQMAPNRTIKFFNNQTKEQIGTATISGNTVYLRDKAGIHYATMVKNPDGTRTLYDPSGKVIEASSLNLPNLPE